MSVLPFLLAALFSLPGAQPGILQDDPPIPNEKEKTWLAPRAVIHFAYHFPPWANLSNRAVIAHSRLAQWLFPGKMAVYDPSSKKTVEGYLVNWADVLKTDWNYQSLTTSKKIIEYFWADPAHRQAEHPGEETCKAGQKVKIVQILTEPFLPAEVPAYSCGQAEQGSVMAAFLLLKRDFTAGLESSKKLEMLRDDPLTVSYHSQLLNSLYTPLLHMWPNSAAILQGGSRNSGGQIWKNKGRYEESSGRLQVAPLPSFLHSFEEFIKTSRKGKEALLWQYKMAEEIIPFWGAGMTVQFGSWQQERIVDSNVIVNVDTLIRQIPFGKPTVGSLFPRYDTLAIYEPWDPKWNLTDSNASNLRLAVHWEEWSCCSTCCCPRKMCGAMETESSCLKLPSFKTRRGFLVLKKIHLDASVDFSVVLKPLLDSLTDPDDKAEYKKVQKGLEQMFDVNPYREVGIALYSTLVPVELRRAIVQNYFEPKFLWAANRSQKYNGVGLVVDRKSCRSNPQKTDCYELAKCRGMKLLTERKTSSREPEVDRDPCSGVAFRTVTMTSWRNWYQLEKGVHYRFLVDEAISGGKKLMWRIDHKKVSPYRDTVACDRQGTAVRGGQLLFTNNSKLDEELEVEAGVESRDITVVATLRWQTIHHHPAEKADRMPLYLGLYFGIGGAVVLILLAVLIVDRMIIWRRERAQEGAEEAISATS